MKPSIESPMTFGSDVENSKQEMPELESAEELEWLISLALDEALDEQEAARLEYLLRQDPANTSRFATWQAVDNDFQQMPHVLPPVDFCDKFAVRLEIQERRRRLRTGVIFGVAAAALWGSVLFGFVLLGASLWSNQAMWLAGLIHNMAYWWVAAGQFGQAVLNTVETLWAAPATRAVFVCYLLAAIAILAGWFTLLRRSTRELPMSEGHFIEI